MEEFRFLTSAHCWMIFCSAQGEKSAPYLQRVARVSFRLQPCPTLFDDSNHPELELEYESRGLGCRGRRGERVVLRVETHLVQSVS